MAEGIKSLATTAGYFAPGAGIADALGLYPTGEGMGPSILQNIRQGNLGQAGFQGLGVLGDLSYAIPGIGIALGTGLKTASKAGKVFNRAQKSQMFRARNVRKEAVRSPEDAYRLEHLADTTKVKMKGKKYPLSGGLMDLVTPKALGDSKSVQRSARALEEYASQSRSIGGRKFGRGGKGDSRYFLIKKDVGLGTTKPASIGVRISDHAPTAKGPSTRGGPDWMNAEAKINVGPKGQIDKVGNAYESTTLAEAIRMIEKMHLKPGKIEDIVSSGRNIKLSDLGVPRVVKGKIVSETPPFHIYRRGGMLPFGIPEMQLP